MKQLKFILFLFTLLMAGVFTSCSKELDLDEETSVQIEKEAKIQRLQEIYDLSFEDAIQAETEYHRFFNEELISETQNFLSDLDVQQYNMMAKLGVTLNINFETAKSNLSTGSLFDLYYSGFKSQMVSKALLGQMPQALKQGENLQKFKDKIDAFTTFFNTAVADFKTSATVDAALLHKNWNLSNYSFLNYPSYNPVQIQQYNYSFTLNENKTMDIAQFYLIPYIAESRAFASSWKEHQLDAALLLSPTEYTVYDNKICFYFHLAKSYDPITMVGFTERYVCYEFHYVVNGSSLTLSNTRIGLYMYPNVNYIDTEMDVFAERYSDALYGTAFSSLTLTAN
ncbi:MAG: hypothetical protein QM594_11240 [Niabella sp.]